VSTTLSERRSDVAERLDTAGADDEQVAGALDDLARINKLLLGTRLTYAGVRDLCARLPPGAPLSLLDVGCGGGELTASVADLAARSGRPVSAVAVDRNPAIVAHARRRFGSRLDVRQGDILGLELADDSFDVAMCSLLLHHLEPEQAVRALHELGRVARVGVVVNDLVRSRIGLAGAHVLVRLLTRNPITRNDAVLSVRRAYTRAELLDLVAAAGLRPLKVRGALGYRVAVTAVAR
jgi:ubiquinone/menaquinone biosynthesis C-methylase UbiE